MRREDGFTIVELLVAILVLASAALAMGAVLTSGARSSSASETRQNLAHRAQQEVERLAALPYAQLAHTAAPSAGSTDAASPLYWFNSTGGTYRWDRTSAGATTSEPLVVSAQGTVATQRSWSDGRGSGTIFAFVTWVTDSRCGSGCPSSQNYKRITVAVTAGAGAAAVKPVYISSIVADPHALPAGKIVNGNPNPLADPNITCRDASGATIACTASVGSANVNEWYLSDTSATATYTAPTTNHPTHPTIAPAGVCTTVVTTGCPKPDLLSTVAPPTPAEGSPATPMLDYSTELAASIPHPGGRVITRDVDCAAAPSATANGRGAMWVTAPLTQATALTGAGGMTLHTQTAGGVSASVTLCVAIYAMGANIANLVSLPPTRLGVVAYAVAEWPPAPTPLSFSFDFVTGGTISVASGQRIGVRVWVAASSGADLVLLYDHPEYPSVLQLNSV